MILFAGIDAGTGGCRCLVVDERGRTVARAEAPWSYELDETGFPHLSAAAALTAVRRAMDGAAAACDPAAVRAIGVTSQRTGVVLVDPGGDDLLISPNADGRAAAHGMKIERAHGDAIYRITGRLPAMLYLPARLAWARDVHPEWIVHYGLSLGDWIVSRMTGVVATESTQAAEMGLFDLAAGGWSTELIEALDVTQAILPPILGSGVAAGELGEGWPFPAGTPIVPGGADTQSAALGIGALAPGDSVVVAGTTMLAGRLVDDPSIDPRGWLWTSPMPLAGAWVREAHCGEAGALVSWMAALIDTDPASLAREAEAGQPGSGGVLVVDPMPSAATDFILIKRASLSFPAPVLALGRPRADVARAVLEGIAFGARAGLDILRDAAGEPASVRVAGGVARSSVFLDALAGSIDRAIIAPTEISSSALGAAIVSAAAHHGGVAEAAEAMHDPGREVAPRGSDGYPAHYAAWRERADEVFAGAARTGGMQA